MEPVDTNQSNTKPFDLSLFRREEEEKRQIKYKEFKKLDIKSVLLSAIENFIKNPESNKGFPTYLRMDEYESAEKYLNENNVDFVLAKTSYSLISYTYYVAYNYDDHYCVTYDIYSKDVAIHRVK